MRSYLLVLALLATGCTRTYHAAEEYKEQSYLTISEVTFVTDDQDYSVKVDPSKLVVECGHLTAFVTAESPMQLMEALQLKMRDMQTSYEITRVRLQMRESGQTQRALVRDAVSRTTTCFADWDTAGSRWSLKDFEQAFAFAAR